MKQTPPQCIKNLTCIVPLTNSLAFKLMSTWNSTQLILLKQNHISNFVILCSYDPVKAE